MEYANNYKKRVPKGNPYNVLADNQFVKVYCHHCKNYIFDLNTGFKGNVVSSDCQQCGTRNYPHSWVEVKTVKNVGHGDNVAFYRSEE